MGGHDTGEGSKMMALRIRRAADGHANVVMQYSVMVFTIIAVAFLAKGAEGRISLLAPSDAKSVRLAADAFADVWEKVTDESPTVLRRLPVCRRCWAAWSNI